MFISTLLNHKCFLDEKLKLESAILHKYTGDASPEALALHQFILESSALIYSGEVQGLMGKDNGLHMSAYKMWVDQLEAGWLSRLKDLYEAKSPSLWSLCHQLLDVDGARGSHRRAAPIPSQINLAHDGPQDEGVSAGKKEKLTSRERSYALLDSVSTLMISLEEYDSQ